jgi:hypothetical protein
MGLEGMAIAYDPSDPASFLKGLSAAVDKASREAARDEMVNLAKGGAVLPASNERILSTSLAELRRPFGANAIKFKIQATFQDSAMIVAHLDARLVIERLNHVCGLDWADAYRPLSNGWVWCDLTVHGVTRSDVGQGDGVVGPKAQVSDALKRAAVKFGVGVSVYAMSRVYLDYGPGPNELRTKTKGDKVTPRIDAKTERWLRDTYARWLGKVEDQFGKVLEHGDEEDFAGVDEEHEPEAEPAEPDVVVLDDERAQELQQAAREAFDQLRERGLMLPGEFQRRLRAASGSHADLEALVADLLKVGDEAKP